MLVVIEARLTSLRFLPKFTSQSILEGFLSLDVFSDYVPQSGADPLPRAAASEKDAPVPHQHSPD